MRSFLASFVDTDGVYVFVNPSHVESCVSGTTPVTTILVLASGKRIAVSGAPLRVVAQLAEVQIEMAIAIGEASTRALRAISEDRAR